MRRIIPTIICAALVGIMLASCATQRQQSKKVFMETGRSAPDAAQAPLRDLNIGHAEIPQVLLDIDYLYRINGPVYCDRLVAEVEGLDAVLGPDDDIAEIQLSKSEKDAEAASNTAQNALEAAATSWIPFRSLVRAASGATKKEREIRSAYEKGRIRRGFLKGVGGAFQCPYPAAPSSVRAPVRMGK